MSQLANFNLVDAMYRVRSKSGEYDLNRVAFDFRFSGSEVFFRFVRCFIDRFNGKMLFLCSRCNDKRYCVFDFEDIRSREVCDLRYKVNNEVSNIDDDLPLI